MRDRIARRPRSSRVRVNQAASRSQPTWPAAAPTSNCIRRCVSAGGLHVILTEYHESRRIDRQLFGRAGRQGDPGSYELIVALDDELFQRFVGSRLLRLVGKGFASGRANSCCDRAGVAQLWPTHRRAPARASPTNRACRRSARQQDSRLRRDGMTRDCLMAMRPQVPACRPPSAPARQN